MLMSIFIFRDGFSRHTYTVEGQSLAVISKTERLPSGAQRTSLEPSIEFQNNTGFRITLRYISDNSPGYPLISVVPQNAKLWLPLSAVSGEYRFRIDTQETMLNETEWIDDISPIGLSEPLLLWDSMFQTEYLDHLDIISDHGNAQFCISLTINGMFLYFVFLPKHQLLTCTKLMAKIYYYRNFWLNLFYCKPKSSISEPFASSHDSYLRKPLYQTVCFSH